MTTKKVSLRQIRSSNGRDKRVRGTLQALGLGRIGKEKKHTVTPTIQGMIKKVEFLLEVNPV